MTRPLVYMAHPYGGKPENLELAKEFLVGLRRRYTDHNIIAPWITLCELMPETPENRELALADCEEIASRCDEVWLVGEEGVTEGMKRETKRARKVCDFTMPQGWREIWRNPPREQR